MTRPPLPTTPKFTWRFGCNDCPKEPATYTAHVLPGLVLNIRPLGLSLAGFVSAVVGLYVPASVRLSPKATTCVNVGVCDAGGVVMDASWPSSLQALVSKAAATATDTR